MRKGRSASYSAPDRETRSLVLWVLCGAAAVAAIGLLAAFALVGGPAAPSYSVAVIPQLESLPPKAEAVPNASVEAPTAPVAPARHVAQPLEADSGPLVPPEAPPAIKALRPLKHVIVRLDEGAGPASPEAPPSFNALPPLKHQIIRLDQSPPPRLVGPVPPERPGARLGDAFALAAARDHSTAVYDISAHTVYLPDGTRLEAHSGLGSLQDDPRSASEVDRGPTPPHLYELTLREEPFHGVQALRLNPVGEGDMFGRVGLLAHTYMLGPKGESNGCVSFKNYDAFLKAYENGQVRRLAVVAKLD
ncbi:MAG: DUF2778 domain-containing protein [Hyphomicrobiales bacterium]|nr:DUF2778 domain-containing protein [Hyphomicrobiales bacterium]